MFVRKIEKCRAEQLICSARTRRRWLEDIPGRGLQKTWGANEHSHLVTGAEIPVKLYFLFLVLAGVALIRLHGYSGNWPCAKKSV